jgi:hypothetical protein
LVKGWIPISVKEGIVQKLEERYHKDRKRPKNQKFTPYVENLLLEIIEYEEALNEYGYIFSLENVTDDHIILMDNFIGKHVFVYFHDSHLYCEEHEDVQCDHVGFCYALPDVYKTLIARGLRPKRLKGYNKKMKYESVEREEAAAEMLSEFIHEASNTEGS